MTVSSFLSSVRSQDIPVEDIAERDNTIKSELINKAPHTIDNSLYTTYQVFQTLGISKRQLAKLRSHNLIRYTGITEKQHRLYATQDVHFLESARNRPLLIPEGMSAIVYNVPEHNKTAFVNEHHSIYSHILLDRFRNELTLDSNQVIFNKQFEIDFPNKISDRDKLEQLVCEIPSSEDERKRIKELREPYVVRSCTHEKALRYLSSVPFTVNEDVAEALMGDNTLFFVSYAGFILAGGHIVASLTFNNEPLRDNMIFLSENIHDLTTVFVKPFDDLEHMRFCHNYLPPEAGDSVNAYTARDLRDIATQEALKNIGSENEWMWSA